MKLLIADDHTLFRDALAEYIERGCPDATVILAQDFHEVLDILKKDAVFDLVILDYGMPGMGQFDGLKVLNSTYPGLPFVLMSGIAETQEVREAIQLGARGYFPKTLSGKAVILAIHQVLEGKIFIPEDDNTHGILPSYYGDAHRSGIQQSLENLNFTPREKDVLEYLVAGATNKEISRALELQVVTIKLHVRGICRKMNVQNRTQAALMAQELGIKPILISADT